MKSAKRRTKNVNKSLENLRIIVDHAHLSKLRPLTIYCIGKANFSKVYQFDIIIPKKIKTEEVGGKIEEGIKQNEKDFIQTKKLESIPQLKKRISNFNKSNLSEEETVEKQMESILSHPLVYKDLPSLVIDLRFKSFLNLELRNIFNQSGDIINSFADLKLRDKCIFLTDDKTLLTKKKELFLFTSCFHTKLYLKEIIPIDLLDNFRNDGTQIMEIEDILTEDCDLDEGKDDNYHRRIDPFRMMSEKLELIRILKKPQRLLLERV